jgi:hypothetical protein
MSAARRGDELHPSSPWRVIARDRRAATGWEQLTSQAPANLRRAWFAITDDPRSTDDPSRQHRLKSVLGSIKIEDRELEQWQYEVTGGGRLWYAIDDERRILWITRAGTAHPGVTDKKGGRRRR